MTYEQALAYYHSFQRFGVQPGLDRVHALLDVLGNPQKKLKFVHVAGTNGKGSTSTMISCIFRRAGYTAGLYTSPYVLCFRERMRVDGEMIPEEELASLTEEVQNAVALCHDRNIFPTEFEVVTAAAFLWFCRKKCDIVIAEVGLGGRFDATNCIGKPEVSVIASVSFDHMGILGNTLSEIAYEKAGIIKENVPVITSVHQPEEVKRVIETECRQKNARLIYADERELFTVQNETISGTDVLYENLPMCVPFPGAHMLENASLAVLAARITAQNGWKINTGHIAGGIGDARIPARIEMLSEEPTVLLDGSHNDGSTAALANVLHRFYDGKKILAVMGMMADKEIDRALRNLLPCFSYVITTTPSNPRAIASDTLSAMIVQNGTASRSVPVPQEALQVALSEIRDFDILVVCGSLYLASDVRENLLSMLDNLK